MVRPTLHEWTPSREQIGAQVSRQASDAGETANEVRLRAALRF